MSRQSNKERTRYRLLQAVLKTIQRHGHGTLTTGRVAQLAGVAQPTFYVHFRSMDQALEQRGIPQKSHGSNVPARPSLERAHGKPPGADAPDRRPGAPRCNGVGGGATRRVARQHRFRPSRGPSRRPG
ncbi:MAG: TetR/AcrR family transcriptional regulator [Deltaproteobacteria bacterium]|nr:TetR/AcrR family transcriptional regulator [Deltaproteobacteria bacterium]